MSKINQLQASNNCQVPNSVGDSAALQISPTENLEFLRLVFLGSMIFGHLIPIRTLQNTPWVSTAHMLSLPGRDFSRAGHLKLLKLFSDFESYHVSFKCIYRWSQNMFLIVFLAVCAGGWIVCFCLIWMYTEKWLTWWHQHFQKVGIYENTLLKNHMMQFHHHSKSFTPPHSLCHIFFLWLHWPISSLRAGPWFFHRAPWATEIGHWSSMARVASLHTRHVLSLDPVMIPDTVIHFSRETRCNPDLFNFLVTFLTLREKNKTQARWKDCEGKTKQNDKTYSTHSAKIQSPS